MADSNSTTFEFETAVEIAEVSETISFLWDGLGGEASVYTRPDPRPNSQPDSRERVFCTLHYLCEDLEDRPVLTPVLQYIHSIALEGKVYCCQQLPVSLAAEYDSRLVTRS